MTRAPSAIPTEAALLQTKGQVEQAKRNLEYTTILAPFDGVVSARLVDPGAYVGAATGSPTKLATIVQVDPIYVNFNIDEQQVLTIREKLREQGLTLKDVGPVPIDVGLQTEKGYPHSGTLNYVAPEIDSEHGDVGGARSVRQQGPRPVAGAFRSRADPQADRRGVAAWFPTSRSATTRRAATSSSSTTRTSSSSARSRSASRSTASLRIIKSGISANDRVVVGGLMRALPGNTVVPVTATAAAAPAPAQAPPPAPPPAPADKGGK